MTTINYHLIPGNTITTKEFVRKLNNNSLELVLFERLDFITLAQSKDLLTCFVDFFTYIQSFASLLVYCHLWLQHKEDLTTNAYYKMINLERDQKHLKTYKLFLV